MPFEDLSLYPPETIIEKYHDSLNHDTFNYDRG